MGCREHKILVLECDGCPATFRYETDEWVLDRDGRACPSTMPGGWFYGVGQGGISLVLCQPCAFKRPLPELSSGEDHLSAGERRAIQRMREGWRPQPREFRHTFNRLGRKGLVRFGNDEKGDAIAVLTAKGQEVDVGEAKGWLDSSERWAIQAMKEADGPAYLYHSLARSLEAKGLAVATGSLEGNTLECRLTDLGRSIKIEEA